MGYEFVIRRQRGCFGELLVDVAKWWVGFGLGRYVFFQKKKFKCVFHVVSHATNYLTKKKNI